MSTIKSSAENLTLNADGANNDIKFQSNGSEVASIDQAGVIVSAGGSTHADNVKAKFGTGNDLEIYHDGSDSIIKDAGTGNLKILAEDFRLQNAAGTEQMIRADQDGAVDLYHNNIKKLETTATGIAVTGAVAGATNLVTQVASGSTDAMNTNNTFNIHTVSGTHSTYLVTASANSSITNVVAIVSIGTSTSTMRITTLSGSYNTTVTGSGTAIQITCAYGSNLVYQYRVLQLR